MWDTRSLDLKPQTLDSMIGVIKGDIKTSDLVLVVCGKVELWLLAAIQMPVW